MFHSAWQDLWQMLLATILWISQLLVLSRTSVIFAHAFFCKTVSGVWYLSATSYDTVMLSELSCYHWCPHRRLDFGWHSTMSRLSPRRANQTIMALLSLIRLRGHFSYLVCPMIIGFLLGKYAYCLCVASFSKRTGSCFAICRFSSRELCGSKTFPVSLRVGLIIEILKNLPCEPPCCPQLDLYSSFMSFSDCTNNLTKPRGGGTRPKSTNRVSHFQVLGCFWLAVPA